MIPTGEMLKSVGFGEKKVSETAEMLNILNFLGVFGTYGIWAGQPKKFNMSNISPAGSIFWHLNPPSLTFQLWESFFDSHSCTVKLWGPKV